MKQGLTELVFILDRSGSMAGLEADTIGGFNAMLRRQRAQKGEVLVSTVLFSNDAVVLHDRIPIREIEPLDERQYAVGGGTALLDAVGGAIHHIGNVHKYARREDVPEHTLFVITTDGLENASRRYSREKVKAMIRRQEERYGWEFLFVAANIDAVEAAGQLGIRKERAANYCSDGAGTRSVYAAVSRAVTAMRSREEIGEAWKEELHHV